MHGVVVGAADTTGIGGVLTFLMVIYLAMALIAVVAWVKIISKAGYSGWWVLIGLVPLVNAVMFLVFAFSDWPVVRAARGEAPYGYGAPGSAPVGYR